jgi:hypothetical protein
VSCPEIAIQSKGLKSMTKEVKTYNRHSICFKEKVIQEVSSGSSISEVSRRYGIKGGDNSGLDKEIWTGRIVKQSNKDRNERRTGRIKEIRESIAGDENSVSRKDDDLGFVRKDNRKSEQSL